MAIVVSGKTGRSLCGATLAETDEAVMFPHFIRDQDHPLWRFSDSAMHRRCFTAWDQAECFRQIYNETWPKLMPNHPRVMLPDGKIVELD